jgi:hypothetical protein
VTPLIAETTETTAFARAASATICAARAMQAASPTEVPPNFITCNFVFSFPAMGALMYVTIFSFVLLTPPLALKCVHNIVRKGSIKIIRNTNLTPKKTELAPGLFCRDRH